MRSCRTIRSVGELYLSVGAREKEMRGFQHLMTLAFACVPVALCAQQLQPVPQPLPAVTPVSHVEDQYGQQLSVMQENPMLWQQYQALQVAEPQGSGGSSCGCGNSWWDRCGCNPEVFPWIDGPGLCDNWCVGPKWQVELEGLMLFTNDVEWDRLQNNLGVTPTLTDQFDHALGARLYVSAFHECGHGLQVGYMGANDWGGTFTFDPNAGIYCNWHKRDDIAISRSTIITGDDLDTADNEFSVATNTVRSRVSRDYSEIAFAGEAGISGVVRLTNCLSVRGGYQVMVVDGMGRALDAFFSNDLLTSTSLYHGMQFGMEYRR